MDFLKIEPESAPCALRAMTMVARAAKNGLGQPQRAMIDAMQRLVLETDLDVQTLQPTTPEELASQLDDAVQARQLIRLMVALSLVDGPPSMEQMSLLSSFEAALGVEEPSVAVVGHLAKKRLLMFRLSFARHSHVRTYFRNSYRLLGGVLPVIKAVLRFRGIGRTRSWRGASMRSMNCRRTRSVISFFSIVVTKVSHSRAKRAAFRLARCTTISPTY